MLLLTNDDGVHAPGIKALHDVLMNDHELIVVAPATNCSGISHAISLTKPVNVKRLDDGFHAVDGTPVDCVHMGLTGAVLPQHPNLMISGINAGENLGDDILYSGTLSAAMEGCCLKVPAIAISLVGKHQHFETAAYAAKHIMEHFAEEMYGMQDLCLNVNVPDIPLAELQGFQITRLGRRDLPKTARTAKNPRGGTAYWIGLPGDPKDKAEGTDFAAIANKYVSITPLQFDRTSYDQLQALKAWETTLNQ